MSETVAIARTTTCGRLRGDAEHDLRQHRAQAGRRRVGALRRPDDPGTTKPVELELEFLGVDPTGTQGETRIGFEGRTTISRKDFGVSFGLATDGSKITDKVEVILDVEAFLGA